MPRKKCQHVLGAANISSLHLCKDGWMDRPTEASSNPQIMLKHIKNTPKSKGRILKSACMNGRCFCSHKDGGSISAISSRSCPLGHKPTALEVSYCYGSCHGRRSCAPCCSTQHLECHPENQVPCDRIEPDVTLNPRFETKNKRWFLTLLWGLTMVQQLVPFVVLVQTSWLTTASPENDLWSIFFSTALPSTKDSEWETWALSPLYPHNNCVRYVRLNSSDPPKVIQDLSSLR